MRELVFVEQVPEIPLELLVSVIGDLQDPVLHAEGVAEVLVQLASGDNPDGPEAAEPVVRALPASWRPRKAWTPTAKRAWSSATTNTKEPQQ